MLNLHVEEIQVVVGKLLLVVILIILVEIIFVIIVIILAVRLAGTRRFGIRVELNALEHITVFQIQQRVS